MNRMLNIGSGMTDVPGWLNLDFDTEWYARTHRGRRIDVNHNLMTLERIPLDDNSIDLAYTSHTIEHIPDRYIAHMFAEVKRILTPGGLFRVTCPDIGKCYDAYMHASPEDREFIAQWKGNHTSPFHKHDFGNQFLFIFAAYCSSYFSGPQVQLLKEEEIRKHFESALKHEALTYYTKICAAHAPELQSKHAGDHISWWDADKLRDYLTEAGFKNFRVTGPRQSAHPACNNPLFDTQKPDHSLYVEVRKV